MHRPTTRVVGESEALDDLLHILGEATDVGAEVLREPVGVVQQPPEIELRSVVERPARSSLQKLPADAVGLVGVLAVGSENRLLHIVGH